MGSTCRVYAPVGNHEDLLPYLARRLLENGANSSFINRLVDEAQPIDALVADPIARLAGLTAKPHPRIPLPRDLFRPSRLNSAGLDLADRQTLTELRDGMIVALQKPAAAGPIVAGVETGDAPTPVFDPADRRRQIGQVSVANVALVETACSPLRKARRAGRGTCTPADTRAAMLERAAELYGERDRDAR